MAGILTINIVAPFTYEANGNTYSVPGHMWYTVTDYEGNTTSYGFQPQQSAAGGPSIPFGAGAVVETDSSNYQGRTFSQSAPITDAQATALSTFGNDLYAITNGKSPSPGSPSFNTYYNVFGGIGVQGWGGNNCISFVNAALSYAGVNSPAGLVAPDLPELNSGAAADILNTLEKSNGGATITTSYTLDGDVCTLVGHYSAADPGGNRTLLSDSWTSTDGSHGTDVYNSPGNYTQTFVSSDNSSGTVVVQNGVETQTNLDVNGKLINTVVVNGSLGTEDNTQVNGNGSTMSDLVKLSSSDSPQYEQIENTTSAGQITATISGTGDNVNLGTGSTLNVASGSVTGTMSSGIVNLGASSTGNITGNGLTCNVGQGDSLTVAGGADNAYVNGTGSTLNIGNNGYGATAANTDNVYLTQLGTINAVANTTLAINDTSTATTGLTASVAGNASLSLTGSSTNNSISVTGPGSSVTAANNSTTLTGSTTATNCTLVTTGTNSNVSASGNYTLVVADGAGSSAYTSGTYSESQTASGQCLAQATGNFSQANTTANGSEALASGYGSLASTVGVGSQATDTGQDGEAKTSGQQALANTTGLNAQAYATGQSSEATTSGFGGLAVSTGLFGIASTSNGAADAIVQGNGATASTSGVNSNIFMSGWGDAASTSNNVIWAANAPAGAGDKISGSYNFCSIGNGVTLASVSANNVISTAANDVINGTKVTVDVGANLAAGVSAGTTTINGSGMIVNASGAALSFGAGSSCTVFGTGDSYILGAYTNLTIDDPTNAPVNILGASADDTVCINLSSGSLVQTWGSAGGTPIVNDMSGENGLGTLDGLGATPAAAEKNITIDGNGSDLGANDFGDIVVADTSAPVVDADPIDAGEYGDDIGDEVDEEDDPVVLNLSGGKVQTTALKGSSAYFDMQNNGKNVQTQWITSGEGFLVLNPNSNGTVTSASQLVSNFGQLYSLAKSTNGILNASNALWSQLAVWVDSTGAGTGQLESLSQLGITSINLNGINEPFSFTSGTTNTTVMADSSFTYANGTTGDIACVGMAFNQNSVAPPASTKLNFGAENTESKNIADLQNFASNSKAMTLGANHFVTPYHLSAEDSHTINSWGSMDSALTEHLTSMDRLIQSMASFGGDSGMGIESNFITAKEPYSTYHLSSSHVEKHF